MKRYMILLTAWLLCCAVQPLMNAMAEETQMENLSLMMVIDETPVQVEWEANASVDALKALAQEAPIVIQMSMYGGFEQVGSIGQSLPRNDQQTTTHAGDIVLYSGNQLVVFYGSNSWAYTRLGRIVDKTPNELKAMMGNGNVTITIDVPRAFLKLPSATERLESEAFAGVSAEAVILPDALKEIAPDVFANSDVRFIYGHANTLAETYAAANGYVFVPIQDD